MQPSRIALSTKALASRPPGSCLPSDGIRGGMRQYGDLTASAKRACRANAPKHLACGSGRLWQVASPGSLAKDWR